MRLIVRITWSCCEDKMRKSTQEAMVAIQCCLWNMSMLQDRTILPGPRGVWWGHVISSIQWVVSGHFWIAAFNHPGETCLGSLLCTEMGNVWVGSCSMMISRTPVDGASHVGWRKDQPFVSGYLFGKYHSSPSQLPCSTDFGFDLVIYFTQWNVSRPDLSRGLKCTSLLCSCDLPGSHWSQKIVELQGGELESASQN